MPKKNEAISSEAHKHYSIRNPKQPIRQKRDPNHRNFANTEREKKKRSEFGQWPFPEIALRFGGDGSPEAVHLDAEELDLSDVLLDGEGELWIAGGGGGGGVLESLEAFEAVAGPQQELLRALVNLRERSSPSFHGGDGGDNSRESFSERMNWRLRTVSLQRTRKLDHIPRLRKSNWVSNRFRGSTGSIRGSTEI